MPKFFSDIENGIRELFLKKGLPEPIFLQHPQKASFVVTCSWEIPYSKIFETKDAVKELENSLKRIEDKQ